MPSQSGGCPFESVSCPVTPEEVFERSFTAPRNDHATMVNDKGSPIFPGSEKVFSCEPIHLACHSPCWPKHNSTGWGGRGESTCHSGLCIPETQGAYERGLPHTQRHPQATPFPQTHPAHPPLQHLYHFSRHSCTMCGVCPRGGGGLSGHRMNEEKQIIDVLLMAPGTGRRVEHITSQNFPIVVSSCIRSVQSVYHVGVPRKRSVHPVLVATQDQEMEAATRPLHIALTTDTAMFSSLPIHEFLQKVQIESLVQQCLKSPGGFRKVKQGSRRVCRNSRDTREVACAPDVPRSFPLALGHLHP